MKCRECTFMSDFGDGLYRCTNHDSVMYMTYTGICCEDECPDCSECHTRFAQTHWSVWKDGSLPRNFCPNCGADFREDT